MSSAETSGPELRGTRPTVTDVERGPHGRRFTIEFAPGQSLPTHRNPSAVVITAITGFGEITVDGLGARQLPTGAVVRLDPEIDHSVTAGPAGLELLVQLADACCRCC